MSDQRYLLNIRNPQVIQTVYQQLLDGAKTEEEIADVTGLEGSLLNETLDGLLAYRLVTRRDFKYVARELAFDEFQRLNLPLTMLSNVRQTSQGEGWDLQAGLYLTYAYFLKEDLQYFKYSDEALATEIDEYHQELGYRAEEDTPDEGPAKLQKEKLNNWAKHATLLGLTHKARGSEYTIAPDPQLIYATIELARREHPAGQDALYVEDYVTWLNENVLRVPFEDQHLPKPIGRVLYIHARNGDLELVRLGDPPTVSMNYMPTDHGNVNRRINAIKMINQ